ncbi:MAG: 3-hydroxyisobutyrate dehydrogenase [Hyphomicrobiales bacterium]|jgi:3-hydroxyisobutyrate dehydrogenase|nr:3-hydroxyisobutyrate dehydrogenase [Hyphomicrobiales bacterium]
MTRDTAVIGLGNMGRGIARNLDRAGRLAAAWDVAEVARTNAALSPEVALVPPSQFGRLAFILFVVPGSAQIEEMLPALLARPHDGETLVDLTTSHPAKTKALAEKARAAGRNYVDCGMSGGAMGADSGKMALMVGGAVAAVAACKPIFDIVAGTVTHVGGSSTGHAIKLLHNMVCHTNFLVVAEAGRLAERAGIPLETAIQVFNAGNARSYISEQRFPNHILSGKFDGRSTVSNLAKDLAMADAFADEFGQANAYTALTAEILAKAMEKGMGAEDFTRLYEAYEELAKSSS